MHMNTQCLVRNGVTAAALLAIAICSAPSVAAAGAAAADAVANVQSGYVLPDTETWDLKSSAGEQYRIFVSRPEGDPPPEGYPVLYVLDGNAFFAGFAQTRWTQEIMDASIGRTMIVAVGYPIGDKPYAFERRMKDFTPPWTNPVPVSEQRFADWAAGGWDRFAQFLIDDLRPAVASRYHIDPHRQSLFGHSLGGLFALHMLYRHPEAFFAIIAASPSIYWNGASILAEEREFASHLASAPSKGPIARLLMVVGSREETRLEQLDAEDLARRLEPLSAYGLRSRFQVYEGEPHLGVPTRAITDTLRFAFTWP
jgi:hypothetical protein